MSNPPMFSPTFRSGQNEPFPSLLDDTTWPENYRTPLSPKEELNSPFSFTSPNNGYDSSNSSMSSFPSVKTNRSYSVGVTSRPFLDPRAEPFSPFKEKVNVSSSDSYRSNGATRSRTIESHPPSVIRSQSAVFSDGMSLLSNNGYSIQPLSSRRTPSQITSPKEYYSKADPDVFNPRSVPVTRRNSNEYLPSLSEQAAPKPTSFYIDEPVSNQYSSYNFNPRKASAPTGSIRSSFRSSFQASDANLSIPPQLNTNFLDDDHDYQSFSSPTSPIYRDYFSIYNNQDNFPILVTHEGKTQLSVSSSALDLAHAPTENSDHPGLTSPGVRQHMSPSSQDRPMMRTRSATHFADLYTANALGVTLDHYPLGPNNHMGSGAHNFNGQELPGQGVCRFFLQGHCTKSDKCQFKHISKAAFMRSQLVPRNPSLPNQARIPQTHQQPMLGSKMGFSQPNFNSLAKPHSPAPLKPFPNANNRVPFVPGGLMSPQASSFPKISNSSKAPRNPDEFVKFIHNPPINVSLVSKDFAAHIGMLSSLCSDQHGCRFLQKKLEEKKQYQTEIIFTEVSIKFTELMTDPFGNYLCQKLIEFCNEEQRYKLVEMVSVKLVSISMNMHGTRAIQKMLEFLVANDKENSGPTLKCIISSIKQNVVSLIKDINGNHVIQKCINRFSAEHNQFIYDSVSDHVVEVSTHRHGCCVLQRCIDSAVISQKRQLANAIVKHAFRLVQDPFGNYVVQYILDLNETEFTELVIHKFLGSVCSLSVQKFSSNVIEKCIRNATKETRYLLIQELLNRDRLDLLIRDSYANYVVQTCLEFAEDEQRDKLVNCIKPLLNSVRGTSYAKRIQSRIQRSPGDDGKPGATLPTQGDGDMQSSFNLSHTSSTQSEHIDSAKA